MQRDILRASLLGAGLFLLAACGGTATVSTSPAPVSSAAAKPSAAASIAASKPAGSLAASKPAASAATSTKPAASATGQTFGTLYSFTTQDYSFAGPDTIQAGLVTLQLSNSGKEPHHMQLLKFNTNATPDQVTTALTSGNPDAVFQFVSADGGVGAIDPSGNAQIVANVQPGQYMIVCFIAGPDGVPHVAKGMYKLLTVGAAAAASASAAGTPQASSTVTLKDFTFDAPDTLPAGRAIIKVDNSGPQIHEMNILKLGSGKTVQDALNFFKATTPPATTAAGGQGPATAKPSAAAVSAAASAAAKPAAGPGGPPPFNAVGGFNGESQNLSGWAVVNLEPGNYAYICNVPDPASGQPHWALGMIKGFTVK